MKEDYLITIDNTQSTEDGDAHYSLSTVGEYSTENGKRRIRYLDSAATGFDGCETLLEIDNDGIVFTRTGAQTANLVLQQGRRYIGHYGTDYGDLALGVYTDSIKNSLNDNGGSLSFSYSIDVNAGFLTRNDLTITVREKKKYV